MSGTEFFIQDNLKISDVRREVLMGIINLLPLGLRRPLPYFRLGLPPLHHRVHLRDLLCRSTPHGLRHQLRLPYGRPVHRRRRSRLHPHDRPPLHSRSLPRFVSWISHVFFLRSLLTTVFFLVFLMSVFINAGIVLS
ncbi:hypothetical protein RHMOL_Rhmol01G0133700 [Rhododendron molle]|nr:hypothetical protein RHMOL_Rhmol01G0133700 [Rhododendron molle]